MGRREVWASYDDDAAPTAGKSTSNEKAAETAQRPAKPFNMELLRNKVLFGGLVGSTTGATFGFVGAFQSHHTKHGSVNSKALLGAARTAGTTGAVFGAFFLAYQGVKTTIEQLRGEEDFLNAGAAVAIAGLPFYRTITFRSHMGYAGLLIALDYFHEEMNNFRR
ncbi:hypothetical protein, variant [Aphanomyces invadans]|uniref:Mitochondrial import inner membrane translocase subunit TIM22 n=1 Tax=Aphanomyces invadans TaxID=157072 RepID=A0A024U1P1_9STRA|nr:hypothetical protein H310_08185 [Aphanomyces invadans]XP_008872069.1 hypothetical protein, variant [Aphanomyces invadans]ETV99512.1 hypothetical protein H310_08185 [Aphanomyces invadans]ETV99513.1 hypothetical protein, variant [Aphanomyces invadans]|eukprot:XP_008872068.1 hypothetical protein H310_08185 [Aphanomyces invadans]